MVKAMLLLTLASTAAENMGVAGQTLGLYLNGVGYREQELQQAKGARFQSEKPEGVQYASFGGGTNIFVSGVGLEEMAVLNMVVLTAIDAPWTGQQFMLPPLTESDEFLSATNMGMLVYRLPAPHTFLGCPQDALDTFGALHYTLQIVAIKEGTPEPIDCGRAGDCRIRYHRSYTPVFHYLNPPVVYNDMLVELNFDPKSTTSLIEDLASDEMAFINAKIAGALIDFEDTVSFELGYSHWWENAVRGYVGDQPIGENQPITMLWETGHAIKHLTRNWHCSYDESECYETKTVAAIKAVSEHTSYLTGGQNITVKGTGFAAGNIVATLDGVACEVTSYGKEMFSCTVGEKAEVSETDTPRAGEHGVRRRTIDGADWRDTSYWYNIDLENPEEDITITHSLAMQYEGFNRLADYYVDHYYAWFVAPATTRYRFYSVCDEHCSVKLDLTPGSTADPTTLVDADRATDKRWSWAEDGTSRVSEWVELTEGEQYYLEGEHQEWSGHDHFTLSVEIERTLEVNDNHHHAKKELQWVAFQTEQTFEKTRLYVRNVDDGEFTLRFMNSETLEKTDSSAMRADASATEVRDAIKKFYDDDWDSGITVTKQYFDVQGTELESVDDEAFDHVLYEISLSALIEGITTADIRIIPQGTNAIFETELPEAVQLSGAPLSGKYKIQCMNANGEASYTLPMTTDYNYHNVEIRIMSDCANFRDKVRVRNKPDYASNTVGSAFFIYFEGIHGDSGQFTVVSDTDEPMVGENLQYFADTVSEYSSNLYYEPIPFEMLRTYETAPQLIVSVDGLPAVCTSVECDFTYAATVGEVTAVTFDDSTGLVTITGTDLPALATDIQSVSFALTECVVDADTVSAEGLVCTLGQSATCGDHVPVIVTRWGSIPAALDFTPVTVTAELSGVFPLDGLNLLGADNITLTGTHFPHKLSGSTVEIKFDDAQATVCEAVASKEDELVCLTGAFDKDVSEGSSHTLTIIINGQEIPHEFQQDLKSEVRGVDALTPSSASPVLKSLIQIQLESDFPYTLAKEDFSVNATSTTDSTYIRYLNVVAVDDSTKTLTVMFGGAYSGDFQVMMRHTAYGLIDTEGMILTVGASVTSYSPSTGSIYGGTLLTISGSNFGNEITDNPVQLAFSDGLSRSWHCYVQTTGPNEITCRVGAGDDPRTEAEAATMVVFLKTSEEALCEGDCGFMFTAVLPTVESYTAEFDAASEAWQVRVAGTGFTGDAASVDLVVDGVTQETVSVSETEALFSITEATGGAGADVSVVLYFPIGIPEGAEAFDAGLALEPKLTRVSPNEGSTGGSVITATAPGVGMATADIELVDSAGQSICDSLEVVAYGQLQCTTVATAMADGPISIKQGGTTTACENSDAAVCNYKQLDDPQAFPEVTSLAQSGDTLVFTGLNFFTSDYSAGATFLGIAADSVTVDSDTQVTATWDKGVPTTSSDSAAPGLSFLKDGSTETHFAISTAVHTNALTVASSSSGLECSFAGGCTYEVSVSSGLASLLKHKPDGNYIQVCESPCEYLDSESTSSAVKCSLPAISTAYSNANFQISPSTAALDSGVHFGTGENYELALDGLVATGNDDSSSTCNVGMEFRAGYVGMLSQVKFFLDNTVDLVLTDNLAFEGSQDGETYENLFTVDENVHEGWNYHTWEADEQPKYRYYRFAGLGVADSPCTINEIVFSGVEAVDDEGSTYACTPTLFMEGEDSIDLNAMTYDGSLTPLLTSISPRFGSVEGGTEVTFSGTGFTTNPSDYSIVLDGIDCPVSSATSEAVTCTTGGRPGLIPTSMSFDVAGRGSVATQGLFFRYVSMWSADSTWGGEFAPMDGESIHIPLGLNLLVDIEKSPMLNLVLVEGSIIFAPDADPEHQRYWDAAYMFVNGGTMEVGTEEHRYTSRITITMHGLISDPYMPIYGNKCIGLRFGTLDIHGPVREPVWTVLESTADAGSETITLQEAIDWEVGELIAIAATTTNGREAEQRTITAIDRSNPDKPVVTIDKPLENNHFASTEQYGDDSIDMRAEVGLLSRKVVYRGDPETSAANEYGATIFIHSPGDDSLTARLTYVEFADVGQGFKVGRYAVHFHMIGAVHTSHVIGCATHQSYNRAYTIHGTHYLTLENNVAFEVKGHNVFIEDAVETHNFIKHNLIIKAMRSWSGLNTDQSPACFWITNPDNQYIENHAAGSDRYGYWFDLQVHAMGPSASTDICPENERVGEFRGNHAHSCGRYGLRIFHHMVPRQFPCKPITYDADTPDDPYHENPPITARMEDYTAWMNGRNGAIAERLGDVRWFNFKTADNVRAGVEMGQMMYGDEMGQIDGALLVGRSANQDDVIDHASPHGVITAKSENMVVRNIKFYNYNWNDAAAIGSCSHCFREDATDSGARTASFEGLFFDSTVDRRIRYQAPRRAIFKDLDGSLTGKGPNSWATAPFAHHEQPECEQDLDVMDGWTCDDTVQIRRVAFHAGVPSAHLRGMGLKILRYDDDLLAAQEDLEAYIDDKSVYGSIDYKKNRDPSNGWATPFVTGHKYKLHWGISGVDFEGMTADVSQRWEEADRDIMFVHNFTDAREAIEVTLNGVDVENATIPESADDYVTGQNLIYESEDLGKFYFIVNGKFGEGNNNPFSRRLRFTARRPPVEDFVETLEIEEFERMWSDAASWGEDGHVPLAGEDATVGPGWNMILDVEDPPDIKKLTIIGSLRFPQDQDVRLRAENIWIRGGRLQAGTSRFPYMASATITLLGDKDTDAIAVEEQGVAAGNKVIANVGTLRLMGTPRTHTMTRLTAIANKGDTAITVEPGLDLVPGDRIALAPTAYVAWAGEEAFIATYDIDTGAATLTGALSYYHWGAAESTGENHGGLDMRGEVLILTRKIRIVGEDLEGWGGQVLTADVMESDGTERTGMLQLDSVEIYNCSQIDTHYAAIRFEKALSMGHRVTRSAIHNGLGWGFAAKQTRNLNISNNIFFNFKQIGVGMDSVQNVVFDSNVLSVVTERTTLEFSDTMSMDEQGGVSICALTYPAPCTDIQVTNNIVAGSVYAGFLTVAQDCDDDNALTFKDNVAHSISGGLNGIGAYVFADPAKESHLECHQASNFMAYKCAEQGIFSWGDSKRAILSNIVAGDLGGGIMLNMAQEEHEYQDSSTLIKDVFIFGEFAESEDCPEDGGFCTQSPKYGLGSSMGKRGHAVPPHILGSSHLPPATGNTFDSVWGLTSKFENIHLRGFPQYTAAGEKMGALFLNKAGKNQFPIHEFENMKFEDVAPEAFMYFYDPPEKWANIIKCGNFPCTGPWNLVYRFIGTEYLGPTLPGISLEAFSLVPDTPDYSEYLTGCEKRETWNAWLCDNLQLGQLLFESEDSDRFDRGVQPVYVRNHIDDGTDVGTYTMNNKLNQMADQGCDTGYASQLHTGRFPSLIQADSQAYDIVYTGSPPKKQRFSLFTGDPNAGVTVRIAYPGSEARAITMDGETVPTNPWDDDVMGYGPIMQDKGCGENRYIGVQNILEFYLSSGCTIHIVPKDSIQTLVRMEWTVSEFFSAGGTTQFVDRLAGSLGIHASTIKVVSVYEGSLVVNYEMTANEDEPDMSLEDLGAAQTEAFATGTADLGGAAVLTVAAMTTQAYVPRVAAGEAPAPTPEPEPIVSDGVVTADGFDPVVLTPTESNACQFYDAINYQILTLSDELLFGLLQEQVQGFKPGCRAEWGLSGAQRQISGYMGMTFLLSAVTYWVSADAA